jgi:L-arginine dehydrogenase
MITLDNDAVQRLLPQIDVLAEMSAMFAALDKNQAVQPPQSLTVFPDGRGDFITYLGALANADVFGAKVSPYLPTTGAPIITAWTILMSMQTGMPLMLCDAGALTTLRTAGTTALAVDLLARRDAATLAIIGSGPVAMAHWQQVRGLRNWSEVRLYSTSLAGDGGRKAEWRTLCPGVVVADTADDAITDADVVMLCTSSGKAVIDPMQLLPDALVTSISTNVALAHEVPPEFLLGADVYCDYRATTPATAGEMILAARDHGWQPSTIRGDLAELVSDNAELLTHERPSFFRSIGLGLEDIAMANAVFRAATD